MLLQGIVVNKKNFSELENRFRNCGGEIIVQYDDDKLVAVNIQMHGQQLCTFAKRGWNDVELVMPEIKMVKRWVIAGTILKGTLMVKEVFETEEAAKEKLTYLQEKFAGEESSLELKEIEQRHLEEKNHCPPPSAIRNPNDLPF